MGEQIASRGAELIMQLAKDPLISAKKQEFARTPRNRHGAWAHPTRICAGVKNHGLHGRHCQPRLARGLHFLRKVSHPSTSAYGAASGTDIAPESASGRRLRVVTL